MARELVQVRLTWKRRNVEDFTSQADLDNPDDLQGMLEDAIKRDGNSQGRHIAEYEIEVRGNTSNKKVTYVGRSR